MDPITVVYRNPDGSTGQQTLQLPALLPLPIVGLLGFLIAGGKGLALGLIGGLALDFISARNFVYAGGLDQFNLPPGAQVVGYYDAHGRYVSA